MMGIPLKSTNTCTAAVILLVVLGCLCCLIRPTLADFKLGSEPVPLFSSFKLSTDPNERVPNLLFTPISNIKKGLINLEISNGETDQTINLKLKNLVSGEAYAIPLKALQGTQPRVIKQIDVMLVPQKVKNKGKDKSLPKLKKKVVEWTSQEMVLYNPILVEQDYAGDLSLGRPTDSSITVSVYLHCLEEEECMKRNVYLLYRVQGSADVYRGGGFAEVEEGPRPVSLELQNLHPSNTYEYMLCFGEEDAARDPAATHACHGPHRFNTAKAPGEEFTFTVFSDSEMRVNKNGEGNDSPYLLSQSFKGAASENPDLHFDIGDFNMNDVIKNKDVGFEERVLIELNKRELYAPYLASIPIFMARGNHEGEFGFNMYNQSQSLYRTGNDMPTTSARARKAVFNNPEPDHFYTGNEEEYPFIGKLQNYFAFEWGDALFVTLDPYWPSTECDFPAGQKSDQKNSDGKNPDGSVPVNKYYCSPSGWQWTLGRAQYNWLTETLEDSNSNHKFVFIHNFFKPRGGASDIPFFEWGGYGINKPDDGTPGEWEFDTMRPGWAKPVHQLLVDNNVDVVMHGHDHVWAFEPQEEEGIIYQSIPKPNILDWNQTIDNCDDGEYVNCKPSSGYTRVAVAEGSFRVEYVREALDPATNLRKEARSGDVMCGYTVTERGANETHLIQADGSCFTSQWSSWQDGNGGEEAQLLAAQQWEEKREEDR